MMQEETPTDKDNSFEGGKHASTEEELYMKALALLEKCKIEPRHSGQKMLELGPGT